MLNLPLDFGAPKFLCNLQIPLTFGDLNVSAFHLIFLL